MFVLGFIHGIAMLMNTRERSHEATLSPHIRIPACSEIGQDGVVSYTNGEVRVRNGCRERVVRISSDAGDDLTRQNKETGISFNP
jgi:hypothetical protein